MPFPSKETHVKLGDVRTQKKYILSANPLSCIIHAFVNLQNCIWNISEDSLLVYKLFIFFLVGSP